MSKKKRQQKVKVRPNPVIPYRDFEALIEDAANNHNGYGADRSKFSFEATINGILMSCDVTCHYEYEEINGYTDEYGFGHSTYETHLVGYDISDIYCAVVDADGNEIVELIY